MFLFYHWQSWFPIYFSTCGSSALSFFCRLYSNRQSKYETLVKNYADPISMNLLFDSVSIMSKNLSADLLLRGSTNNDLNEGWNKENGYANLIVDAAFTGKSHVGVLEKHNSGLANAKSQARDNLIDEDYIGTYHITTKISHAFNKSTTYNDDDWLPCCSSGFAGMNIEDARPFKSAEGIFDCTCYKAPSTAQFLGTY